MWVDQPCELSTREYDLLRALVYEKVGINLGAQKQQLVRARLGKRLREGQFRSYEDYYEYVKNDQSGHELSALIDAISTNTTHLFREPQHFEFVTQAVQAWVADPSWCRANSALRIWSAGCSLGDEPYSLAITLAEALGQTPRHDWRLLATDISTRVLAQAQTGAYTQERLAKVPGQLRQRYFAPSRDAAGVFQVIPALQQRITFRRFNLMTPTFPFKHGFNFIFCRNVMIYFDRPTQEGLVRRFSRHLRPGGYLVIGHSESLNSLDHGLQYVQPTVYRKPPSAARS